jgi:hypothetical protein
MLMVFPVGIPCFYAFVLWKYRRLIYPQNMGRCVTMQRSADALTPDLSELMASPVTPMAKVDSGESRFFAAFRRCGTVAFLARVRDVVAVWLLA